jgi:hypothetical protein
MSPKRVYEPFPDGGLQRPACGNCGAKTRLARREPHPDLGPEFELVTFECGACGRVQAAAVLSGEID